ncbi:MAG: alkyl sulfatase C-terminal domain-containing protein [Chloroflexota bacterium]
MYANKEALYAALDQMVANLNANDAFLQRIERADVSVGFVVSDLEAEYTLALRKGRASGAIGGAAKATIAVTLNAETLDALLAGDISGESAYYAGRLQLRGDEWTGEIVAGYLYHITPAYKAARG